MQRRQMVGWLGHRAVGLAGLALGLGATPVRAQVSESDAALGVRQALERGAAAAVAALGRTDGFLGNPRVRIQLPGGLEQAARLMRATGQGAKVDELETAMNRAAEQAVPQARDLLVNAVKSMSIEDARRIVGGGDDAATRFFADKTREPLTGRFLPIVTRVTERIGLAARYNAVASRAAGVGLVKGDAVSVERHVTAKALDGLYLMIAEEERRLRQDPVAAGSALLKKVFGAGR
jgi:hypothetical protein